MDGFLGHVIILATLASTFGNSENIPYPKKIVPGIYLTPSAEPLVYQTVVPLVYEFAAPKWSKDETIIPRSQNCSSSDFTSSSTCPVLYYLPELQDRFATYIENSNPFGRIFESISGQSPEIEFDCDVITPHFKGNLLYEKEVVDRYLQKLKQCSTKESMYYQNLRNYNYNISGVLWNMRRGFYTEFWLKVNDGRIDAALWSNAINTFNSLVFNNFYMESNRWKLALSDCQAGRLPSSLITKDVLQDNLSELFEKLARRKFTPAVHLRDIAQYFTFPLTDCTFTDKETFIVRILVPIQMDTGSYSLASISTVPFVHVSENTTFICEIRKKNNLVLLDNNRKRAYEAKCIGGRLCQSPRSLNGLKVDSCASAVNEESYRGIVRYCDLNCEEMSPWQSAPVTTQIKPDSFIMTMKPGEPTNTVLRCPPKDDVTLVAVDDGAVEIELPCECNLYADSDVIGVTTCDEKEGASQTSTINHVVPLHWINEERLDYVDIHKPRDMSFRRSGLVIRTTSKKFSNSIDADAPSTGMLRGSTSTNGGGGGAALTTLLTICFMLIFVIMALMYIMYTKVKILQGTNGYSGQQVTYVNVDGPLLENEETADYHNNLTKY